MIFKAKTEPQQLVIPLKRKKSKLTKKDRLVVFSLFLFTTLTSGIFYLKAELPKFKEKIKPWVTISRRSEEKKFDPSPVLAEISQLTTDLRGVYGLYVYRSKDGEFYGLNQNEVFPAASLMKLPVILTLYRQAEAGKIDLQTGYKLLQADKRGGVGVLAGKPAGSTYTYRELAQLMGRSSDNTANNILTKVLGSEQIKKTITEVGMEKTSFENYTTTPYDMGLFFRRLYQGEMVNAEHRREILELLTRTSFEDRLPAGIPAEIVVAHKIGTELGVFADAGIVFARQPLVVVMMSKSAKETEAKEVLPQISKAVWEWETGDSGR